MAAAQKSVRGVTWSLVAVGAALVAASTPLNLLLLLLCRSMAGRATERYMDSGPAPLEVVANVVLFLALCVLALLVCRHASVVWQAAAVMTALLLHLGLWLGGSAVLAATIVATSYTQ